MKTWTRSQNKLMELASEPVKGFSVDVVKVHDFSSGVTSALKHISKPVAVLGAPRHFMVCAPRCWDAVTSIAKHAGEKVGGLGYLGTLWNVLRKLSGDARQPIVLWLDEVYLMKPADREVLMVLCEHVAERNHIPLRVVMLLGKTRVWHFKERRRIPVFVNSTRIEARARVFEFTREDLNETESTRTEFVAGRDVAVEQGLSVATA